MIPVRAWVVEDDSGYRAMLCDILSVSDSVVSCEGFPSCIEMFEQINPTQLPDVVLMDLGLPHMSGVDGIRKLMTVAPELAVIVLTVFSQKGKVFEALEAGASGYLLKSASGPEIVDALQDVVQGSLPLSPAIAKIVLDKIRCPVSPQSLKLAAREVEVLEKLALDFSVKQIARDLDISQNTVTTYLRRIYSKLQVQSQSGAVAKAIRRGLIR